MGDTRRRRASLLTGYAVADGVTPVAIAALLGAVAVVAVVDRPAIVAVLIAVQEFLPTIGRNIVTGYVPELPSGAVWQYTESQYVTLLVRGGFPLLIIYGLLNWTLFAEARRRSRWQGVDRVIGRTVEALTVILVPMLVLANYFINSGLAELWWILAGLLFAGVPTILNEEGRAKVAKPFGLAVGTTANAMSGNRDRV